ncbi:putative permease [Aquisphaera giovannonii]|uniref:Putative permease n=1 Tax=Aquisphaera giovannonii TaxID=406548 RepID=A0A5B9WD26_9BACT|nr:permease [Aquisphaera giovannonii]QEH38417.1 putative permease [Aquisphaera giovannonii]
MTAANPALRASRIRCHWRPLILGAAMLSLLGLFWFASRYPQLFKKAEHLGKPVASMAFGSALVASGAGDPTWWRIAATMLNWLDGMKIGMSFGVAFGALLHTTLRYYPMKIGRNLYLNSIKGALVGVPMGVCANCAVPAACGVTRGHGRVETALGFLFSSPNFNPVVVMMTIMALPPSMVLAKYLVLLLVITAVVPGLIGWLERRNEVRLVVAGPEGAACDLPAAPGPDCSEPFLSVLREVAGDMARNAWMLLKPTVSIMLLASLAAAILLVLVPWNGLLARASPWRFLVASVLSTFMPVPIALDVMFASQLQGEGVAPGFVMLFAMTLGTYSIVPSIYLWRDVSKPLAVLLFGFFVVTGWLLAMAFSG